MQFAIDLWMPILIGGLAVFVMSALVWTVFPHHKKEWAKFSNEDAVAAAIRAGNPVPRLYHMPHVAYITIAPNGVPSMGPMMAKSALSSILIALFLAYVAWHAIPAGAEYLGVFRIVATVAFMTYAFGSMADSIWFARPWSSWILQAFDALLYGLVLGGIFGWLWPAA